MLQNAVIAARISELQTGVIKRVELASNTILEEIRRLALSDIGDLFDDDGMLLPLKEMSAAARATIASIDIKEGEGGVTSPARPVEAAEDPRG